MPLYPETSPSAPVTRDDLAAILAMQGLAGGQQPGDASSVSLGALFGANTPSFESGQPSPNSAGFTAPGGAMTTANASMVGDPMGESGPIGVPGYGREGDTTAPSSQASQAADRAALADAALAAAQNNVSDPLADASQTFGSAFSTNSPGFMNAGAQPAGVPTGYSTTNQPGATPVSTTSFTNPNAPPADAPIDMFESGYNDFFGAPPAGNLFEGQTPSPFAGAAITPTGSPTMVGTVTPQGYTQPSGRSAVADAPIDMFESGYNDFFGAPPAGNLFEGQTPSPFAGAAITPTGSPTMVGTVHPSGYTGRSAVSDPSDPGDPGNAPSAPGSDFSAAGFSGPGGFGAFGGGAATGGYEGSASMGNTTGAQGFTAGGGGFGDFGAASPGTGGTSAGGDPGGGAVGGFGGGESGGSSPGSGADPGGGVG